MVIQILESLGLDKKVFEDLSKSTKIRLFQSTPSVKIQEQILGIYTELSFNLDEKFLSNYKSLRYIATPTTSITHIDIKYCNLKNIQIISLKNFRDLIADFTSTVEIAWWHLIELNRLCTRAQESVINKEWNRNNFFTKSFSKRKIGIIGFGRIGKQIAKIAQDFGLQVKVFDIETEKLFNLGLTITKAKSLTEIFNSCDFVVICVDDRESNVNLINSETLSHIVDKGIILVNISRGFVLNSQDCVNALESGLLGGLGVDVLPEEEITFSHHRLFDNPIISAKINTDLNISITPHIGGATIDSLKIAAQAVFEELYNSVSQLLDKGQ
jgi:lactate dehydrogenase-like 2-hydroxyacid dehydrogenase